MNLYVWLTRTMLIERLLGVTVYAGLLLIMYLSIRGAKDSKTLCKVLNVYIVLLCIMAFFYIPGENADLFRWRQIFDMYGWAQKPFLTFLHEHVFQASTPVAYLYMYLCNITGIHGILPLFCAGIFYSNVFYILKNLHCRHGVSAHSVAELLLMFMSAGCFLEVISGVRCLVALSVLGRCFYDEIYNNKSIFKCILWEGLAALTHSMAAVLLAGRLVFWLFQNKQRGVKQVVNLVMICVIAAIAFKYGSEYFVAAYNKGLSYLLSDDTYSYSWEFLMRGLVVLQMVIIFTGTPKTSTRPELKDIKRFSVICFVLDVVFIAFDYNVFHRLNTFLLIVMMPLAGIAMDRNKYHLTSMIRLLSLLILALACTRGNLCGYKFFLL